MSVQNSNNVISSAPLPSSPPLPPRPVPSSPGQSSAMPSSAMASSALPSSAQSSPVPSSAPANYVPPAPAQPTGLAGLASGASSSIPPGLIDDVYSGTAAYGIYRALLSALGATVIGILLICLGVYIVKLPQQTSVQGRITQINGATGPNDTCPSSIVNKVVSYSCQYTVEYTFQGQKYTQILSYNGTIPYLIGQGINVYITSNNPQDASLSQTTPNIYIGWGLIVLGVVIIGGGWLMFWAAKKWKVVAAAQGAEGIASMFGRGGGGGYGPGYGGGGYGPGYGGGGYNMGGGGIGMDNPLEDIKLF